MASQTTGSSGSAPASSTSPSLQEEAEASSSHTRLNTAELTGHAAEEKERNMSKKSDAEQNQRDLDMLADTVRSFVADVVRSAASSEVQAVETLAVSESEEVLALPSSSAEEVSSKSLARPAPESEKPKPKRQKRCEYSDETRALCVLRHEADGASYAAISKEMGIPHDTVRAIVRKAKRTGTVSSAPRSGRPRKTNGIVDKVILEAVKANKQCSARSIQEELLRVFGIKISPETVRRRVQDHTKQRIQSIANGASSEGAAIPATDENSSVPASDAILDVSEPRRSAESTVPTTSLPAVSFQELLHGEGLRKSGPVPGSVSAGVAGPAIGAGSSPPAIDATAVLESPVQTQSHQPESEPSPITRSKRGEYSIETREQCVALHDQGQGYRKIGKALSMPHTTVRAIVEKALRTGTVLPAKRTGRPRKTDEIVDKIILQAVKANEKSSARVIKEQLMAAYGVQVSCETIRRRVKDHGRQCVLEAEALANDTSSDQQETTQERELVHMAMANRSSAPAPSLMTFDENGVHI